jgi:hypothetical protein
MVFRDLPLSLGKAQRLVAGQTLGLLAQIFFGRARRKRAACAIRGGPDSPFPEGPVSARGQESRTTKGMNEAG